MPESEFDSFMLYRDYYFEHLNLNPDSLLQKVYGIYQIQIKGMNPLNFVFMENPIITGSRCDPRGSKECRCQRPKLVEYFLTGKNYISDNSKLDCLTFEEKKEFLKNKKTH